VKKQLFLSVFAVTLYLFGLYTLIQKIGPFYYFFYVTSWWSYIIFLDVLLSLKHKRFIVLNRYLLFLIVISSGYWCLFELINIRLQNWFYINLPQEMSYRYLGYLFGFGTVLPGIYLTQEAIKSILGKIRIQSIHIPHYSLWALLTGATTLVLTIAVPQYCFAFAWVFPFLSCDGINYLSGYNSLMGDFQGGRMEQFISTVLSGLICGFFWESWNYWSLTKWVYSVPFFEKGKIFEMPLAGYAGFLIFSLGTISFKSFLDGTGAKGHWKSIVLIVSVVCSALTFPLIDSHTVFSYTPKTKELAFLRPDTADLLNKKNIFTSYEIDPQLLNKEERLSLELLRLKGLGYKNLSLLEQAGIYNVEDLTRIDEASLSAILKEKNMRRVRIYLNAAKEYKKISLCCIDIQNVSMLKYQSR
jgi:hypothetical protein